MPEITSIHLCRYSLEEIYGLIEKDLAAQGLTRTDKKPVSSTDSGKEVWTFEAISKANAVAAVRGPYKKGGTGRKKKDVYQGVDMPAEPTEQGVVAPTEIPFSNHPLIRGKLRQVG